MTPEFSRIVRLDALAASRVQKIEANAAECQALAVRFDLQSLESLTAKVTLDGDAAQIIMTGSFNAALTQSCVASGLPVVAVINAPVLVRIVSETEAETEEEIELSGDDCDVIGHDGQAIDIGEIIAQSLALEIDPWPRHADAEAKLAEAGVVDPSEVGPFAALKALKGKLSSPQ
jgi:uncharacterized metal-binding protein YceD (DUF177 family)